MKYVWCSVPSGDGESVQLFVHRGIFTEDDFVDYYVRLASHELVVFPGTEVESHACYTTTANAQRIFGVRELWQCAYCTKYKAEQQIHKANSLLTYIAFCILPISAYMNTYIYMCE